MTVTRIIGLSLLALAVSGACTDRRIDSAIVPSTFMADEVTPAARALLPASYLEYLKRTKPEADEKQIDDLRKTFIIGPEGQHALRTEAGDFLLQDASLLEQERLSGEKGKKSDLADPFETYVNANPYLNGLNPSGFAPLPIQAQLHQPPMPVRTQGPDRQTCVAHASAAALEMFQNDARADLSEEFAHHLFLHGSSHPTNCCTNAGVLVPEAATNLSNHGIPLEMAPWDYRVDKPNCDGTTACKEPSHDLANETFPQYHATRIERIPWGLTGPTSGNPAYLETLIAGGANIVYSLGVAWNEKKHPTGSNPKRVIDVTMKNGAPLPIWGSHAVLLVGYDRNQRIFIARNSFSKNWGHAGYAHFSYDYLITYAGSGFIIREMHIDTAPH